MVAAGTTRRLIPIWWPTTWLGFGLPGNSVAAALFHQRGFCCVISSRLGHGAVHVADAGALLGGAGLISAMRSVTTFDGAYDVTMVAAGVLHETQPDSTRSRCQSGS